MEIRDASVLVQGNGVFSSSATGVIISVTDVQYLPDLGGGAEGSIGGNEFSCKNSDDLRVSIPDGAVLFAQDNYWDPEPLDDDISISSGAVNTDGSASNFRTCL